MGSPYPLGRSLDTARGAEKSEYRIQETEEGVMPAPASPDANPQEIDPQRCEPLLKTALLKTALSKTALSKMPWGNRAMRQPGSSNRALFARLVKV
jgi:hypothetical protein